MDMKRVKRSLKLAFAALIIPIVAMAQQAEELLPTVKLDAFDAIQIDGELNVSLIAAEDGDSLRIVYDLDDNDPERFSFEVNDAGLLIVKHKYTNRTIGVVDVKIYYNEIKSLNIRKAKVKFESTFELEEGSLELSMSDMASLSGEVNCLDIYATVGTQSELSLSGTATFLTANASNKSKLELRSVESLSAEVQSSLGSTVALTAGKRLIATAATNGVVKYWGDPVIMRSKTSIQSAIIKAE